MTEDVKPEVVKKTQDSLGRYIKKPVLAEKLLKKPPFRFLHDIVVSVIRETGFLKGLFNDTELLSENVKDREAKILFLQKLIDCLAIVTGKSISARPSKIVAGLEPTKTNELLQVLAYALHKKLNSSAAVEQLQQGTVNNKIKSKEEKKSDHKSKDKTIKTKSTPRSTKSTNLEVPTKKSNEKRESKAKESPHAKTDKIKSSKSKEEVRKSKSSSRTDKKDLKTKDISPPTSKDDKTPVPTVAFDTVDKENFKIESAANPDNIETYEREMEVPPNTEMQTLESEEKVEVSTSNEKANVQNMRETENLPDENTQKERAENESVKNNAAEVMKSKETSKDVRSRPKTSLRPPSVRVSSARPGAPRLKDRNELILPADELIPMGKVNVIVENFSNKDEDNEETVVMETAVFLPPQEPAKQTTDMPAEKGHLVEQILEQLNESALQEGSDHKNRVEVEWHAGNERNRAVANKEMEKLRESIQTLTRAANPLGKLMNFLQEDVDSMRSELKMWTDINKKLIGEIQTMEKINNESIQPLREQLQRLDQDIAKQTELILNTRGNILRNEQKIKALLVREN